MMPGYRKKFLILALSFFLTVPVLGLAKNMEKIFYLNQSAEKKGIQSLQANADKIDILAPQFFAVTSKMKISGKLDNNLNEVIAQNKIKVMPLIVNAGFKQSVIHKLLLSKSAQDDVIKGLIYIAKKDKYIGWQFDFENISYLDKDAYSSFVERTASAFHKKGLILSVAAITRTCDYEDTDAFKNWGGAFDYVRIAKAADFVSLMTYDDPHSVGPVASVPFIKNVLAYVKDKIPPEKLSLGIPLYYWSWSTDPLQKVVSGGNYNRLSYIKSNFQYNTGFDDTLGSAWLTYFWENKQYKIWYQDKPTFQNKIDIINQNGFRGFSAWVLGVEDPGIWTTLK